MKKFFFLVCLIAFASRLNAQSIAFTTITPPCNSNGVVVATFTGMSLPIVAIWNSSGVHMTDTITTGNTDTLYNFPGGTIYVYAVYNSYLDSINNTDVVPAPFVLNVTSTNGVCPGLGSASVTVTGGTGPFTYQWVNNSTSAVVGTSSSLSLPAGSYSLKVTDASGCVVNSGASISVNFDFTDSITTTNAICPGNGTATVHTYSGTGTFTYVWTNSSGTIVGTTNTITQPGGTYHVAVTDGTGCTANTPANIYTTPDFTSSASGTSAVCPGLGTGSVSITGGTAPFTYQWTNYSGTIMGTTSPANLPAGNYIVTITDALGCSAQNYLSINVVPDFTATITTTPANCTNGTASVTVSGGVAPLSYLWSNGATTSSITGLIPGNYNVLITDALGCTNDSTAGGNVPQAITITVSTTATPTTCVANSGATTATCYGGTAPYSFLWSNGATTATASGLATGYYDVAVTDVNGCKGSGGSYISTIVPISVNPPTVTASACTSPTGTATITTITGGTAPYTVVWHTTPVQTGYTATGLAAGTYDYVVTDAAGCVKYTSITIPPIYTIGISFTTTPATCTLANGAITATPSGGVAPYTYLWSGSGATTSSLSSIVAGSYGVTITDVNGCSTTRGGYIPVHSPLILGISTTPASCIFLSNGTLTATASSGTPPYHFSMGGSSSGSVTITGLVTSGYSINVSDASGCTANGYGNVGYNASDSSCYCTIRGTVYNDLNRNCIQDPGEPGIPDAQIHVASYMYTYTDASGYYSLKVPSGSYTVTEGPPVAYSLATCQPNHIPVTATAAPGCNIIENFADTLLLFHDMVVSTWDYSKPEPGFSYSQITTIHNAGTYTEPYITASYWADGTIYAPTFIPSGSYTGSPYLYNTSSVPSLAPGASTYFYMNYFVPASVPLGTILVFKDTVSYSPPLSTWINDSTPWNNVDYFNPYTVGPYDPNFKEVKPVGSGPEGYITYSDSVLEYMVHFQNTGTYPAQNVVVTDTLDPYLDWTTLTPTYMSANGTVAMDEHGHVTFTFENIDLPPSSSEPFTSNGMFTYTIKTVPGTIPVGTQIRNRASIYFDYNAPIMTNSTLNTIVDTIPALTYVSNLNSTKPGNTFNIYPNPADKICTVALYNEATGSASLRILDISGKIIVKQELILQKGQQNIPVDLTDLAPGVYFVNLIGNGTRQTQKLVILK